MHVAVVDCGSSKVPEIARLLEGVDTEVVALAEAARIDADAVVISGGPRLFTEEPTLIDAFAFIDSLTVPILGICLGHQALGMRDGARVFLGEARRGAERIRIEHAHPLFDGLDPAPVFREDHCEGIDLPGGWLRLASSAAYAVEAMAHRTRPRIGVQFHPEVSGDAGRILLRNWVRSCRGSD